MGKVNHGHCEGDATVLSRGIALGLQELVGDLEIMTASIGVITTEAGTGVKKETLGG
jgi:hypothetical protein